MTTEIHDFIKFIELKASMVACLTNSQGRIQAQAIPMADYEYFGYKFSFGLKKDPDNSDKVKLNFTSHMSELPQFMGINSTHIGTFMTPLGSRSFYTQGVDADKLVSLITVIDNPKSNPGNDYLVNTFLFSVAGGLMSSDKGYVGDFLNVLQMIAAVSQLLRSRAISVG